MGPLRRRWISRCSLHDFIKTATNSLQRAWRRAKLLTCYYYYNWTNKIADTEKKNLSPSLAHLSGRVALVDFGSLEKLMEAALVLGNGVAADPGMSLWRQMHELVDKMFQSFPSLLNKLFIKQA